MKEYISYVVIDTETGGLSPKLNPILEISLVPIMTKGKYFRIYDDNIISEYILPYSGKHGIDSRALQINKISIDEVMKKGRTATGIIKRMIRLSKSLMKLTRDEARPHKNNKPIIVGHNIDNFDIGFLKEMFRLCGYDLYDYYNLSTIDTYRQAQILFSNGRTKLDNLKLETLCKYFGIEHKHKHRAYGDAYANAKLFLKIFNDKRYTNES